MNTLIDSSLFFGALLSLSVYCLGLYLRVRFRLQFLNPLMLSAAVTIAVIIIFRIDYNSYREGAKYLSYLLTPATVCLAIPLYVQLNRLKQSLRAVLIGIVSGAVTSLCSILLLSYIFRLSHEEYVTFLPKSITTAIGIGVSEELGGYVPITAAVIIITGITGSMMSDIIFRLFKIDEPIARGTALGSGAHAIGTAKALEAGELEGAVSSLSIVISGIVTVAAASVFDKFY